jgi:hypothetical protein
MDASPSFPLTLTHGARLAGMTADELRLQGVTLDLQWPAAVADPAGAPLATQAADAWALAPLHALAGELRIHVTDAAWLLDADVRLPIDAGVIDFNRATVSHVGPDSSMGLSRMGVYVDAPNGRQYLAMLSATHLDGARFEHRGALLGSLVTDRGAMALAPLLLAVLGGARPFTPAADAQVLLRRTRLDGRLRLGDGPLGRDGAGLVLTGAATGRNRLELVSAEGATTLLLRWPELSAERLRWPLAMPPPASSPGSGHGSGSCTADSLSGSLSIELAPLPRGGLRAVLRATELLLRKLRVHQPAEGTVERGPEDAG